MARPDSKWYKLDSAGILYSALQKEEYSAIYRFSARMEREVDPAALQRTIDRCMPRFPSFAVRIRKGLFWYYLEPNHAPGPFLKEDVSDPCQPVRFREDNGWLVRFYYYRERISVEVFHALSDGGGAIVFFRTLLAEYLRQTGVDVPAGNGVLDLNEPPREEELEDAYARYAGRHAFGLRRLPRAYQNTGTPEPFYTFHVTMGFVPLSRLREQAKKHNASITEYLSAVLIHVILEKQKRERPYRERPVALAVPINLRAWFPSETLRNFITTVRPYIDPALGDYTFPEIVSQVRHFMKLHINRQELQAAFTGNVRFTENFALRLIPVVLKNPVMALNYRLFGVRPYRRWRRTSAERRSFSVRRPCRAATAPPSATAIPWRSPLPARRRRRTPSAIFSASSCARASPCAWRATAEERSERTKTICHTVSTAAWSWIPARRAARFAARLPGSRTPTRRAIFPPSPPRCRPPRAVRRPRCSRRCSRRYPCAAVC